ncbi:MAG: 1-(5-phosphoribosyl)-5-[(5-phosphoribosylamino)methylideneamino]imidazole-4-carboxamide isomerase [Eubacteriales bacterium]|nr:1-(5-phosphoribosyl)-5-[(5-phosphoribosylamino)methylideneamino]imidazole-4-carboxamide isomerase [Eubacteriales bacterium]
MRIFPAIDLYEGKAVRLYKGKYDEMTVYSENPSEIGAEFAELGAEYIHIVDLEGARDGGTPNFDAVVEIKKRSGCFCEVGGGIRSMDVIGRYLEAGMDAVILGTAAVKDPGFLEEAVAEYGDKIVVGVDLKDGYVAIKGWTEKSQLEAVSFCEYLQGLGVRRIIVTDIAKDGAMEGTNHELYQRLSREFGMQIVASGGVSSMEDVRRLAAEELYGAIIGKGYYTGAIDLKEAIEVAKC